MVFSVRRMARKLRVTPCGEEIHRTGASDEIGSQASRRARLTTALPAFHARLLSGLSDMSDANARSDGNSGAGVLELLRLFKGDAAAADQYAITQLGKARAVEPVLKAFEYLPLDVARKPGPLSGIPAGIIPLALGTQTLGSIIRPAAFNGVVGFKPSFGAIPRTGVHPLSPSLDHVGFFARRVDDAAYALSLLGGASDSDFHGRPVPAFQVSIEQGLSPLAAPRLAIVRFAKWSKAEPEQQQLFDAAVVKSRDAGATLEERELPELDRTNWSTINTILASEAALSFSDLVQRYPDRTSNHLKDLVRTGKAHTAYDYLAAKALQEKLRSAVSSQLSGFDAVLTLPAFGEAPEGLGYTGDAQYCAPWTLLGTPAVSLPAGFGKNGLPLGLQIVGAYRQDYRTLRVAKWIESVLKFDPGIPRVHPTEV